MAQRGSKHTQFFDAVTARAPVPGRRRTKQPRRKTKQSFAFFLRGCDDSCCCHNHERPEPANRRSASSPFCYCPESALGRNLRLRLRQWQVRCLSQCFSCTVREHGRHTFADHALELVSHRRDGAACLSHIPLVRETARGQRTCCLRQI